MELRVGGGESMGSDVRRALEEYLKEYLPERDLKKLKIIVKDNEVIIQDIEELLEEACYYGAIYFYDPSLYSEITMEFLKDRYGYEVYEMEESEIEDLKAEELCRIQVEDDINYILRKHGYELVDLTLAGYRRYRRKR